MAGCTALIVAAGRGTRAGAGGPKQYRRLGGRTVLRCAVEAFSRHPRIDAVRVVIHPDDRDAYRDAVQGLDLLPPVDGGASRQESVRLGLESLAGDPPGFVLIHDAARPFVDAATIDRVIDALATTPAAIAALPVVDTLKRQADGREDGAPPRSAATVARDGLWRAQTPQGFDFAAILAAHRRFAGTALTDDAAVAECAGLAVMLVAGNEENVKLTTEEDLRRAGTRLPAGETRTGLGFDVHRFGPGDHVMLCGVAVPHGAGLDGHSDADVGLHALTDALLGAIAEGDIGQHFPPSDPRWRGVPSALFLQHAGKLVREAGAAIVNVDVTIICERPKVGPHRVAMQNRIGEILGLPPGRVSVKATTTERLGFTGRGEGIAAQAIAAVRLPVGSDDQAVS